MTLCIIFHVFSCLIPVIRHVYHKASVNENQIYNTDFRHHYIIYFNNNNIHNKILILFILLKIMIYNIFLLLP